MTRGPTQQGTPAGGRPDDAEPGDDSPEDEFASSPGTQSLSLDDVEILGMGNAGTFAPPEQALPEPTIDDAVPQPVDDEAATMAVSLPVERASAPPVERAGSDLDVDVDDDEFAKPEPTRALDLADLELAEAAPVETTGAPAEALLSSSP